MQVTETQRSTITPTTSPSSIQTNLSPSSSQASNNKAVLTSGAIAGIAIGPTAALLVGLLILYVVRRNHKKQATHQQNHTSRIGSLPDSTGTPLPAYSNTPMKQKSPGQTAEIDGRPVSEI